MVAHRFTLKLAFLLIACGGFNNVQAERRAIMSLTITSPAFSQDGSIPAVHTCDGEDISPELNWSDIPGNTKSLVLIVDDPDAPDPAAPKMTWVHWVLYNIPATAAGFAEGINDSGLPEGTLQGLNDWKSIGYGGPCPPIGRHRYFHKLYALDTLLPDLGQAGKTEVEQAMAGHIIEQAVLMGTYQH
jgi:Raf kinase inhibitor-like YbhB/YbcL family protein